MASRQMPSFAHSLADRARALHGERRASYNALGNSRAAACLRARAPIAKDAHVGGCGAQKEQAMEGMRSWLGERFAERPWWMNVLLVFSAFMTFVYMPWDFFFKPVLADEEAWFGILLRGPAAKLTEPLHWAIYAARTYGFWRMRPWMWPW